MVGLGGPLAGANRRSELYVVRSDGSDLHEITLDGGFYWDAKWAPDGRGVAASWQGPAHQPDIYLVDPIDGTRRNLTHREGWDLSPVWSPDGGLIAFVSDRDVPAEERAAWGDAGPYQQSLFVMEADGSHVRRLVKGDDFARPTGWR